MHTTTTASRSLAGHARLSFVRTGVSQINNRGTCCLVPGLLRTCDHNFPYVCMCAFVPCISIYVMKSPRVPPPPPLRTIRSDSTRTHSVRDSNRIYSVEFVSTALNSVLSAVAPRAWCRRMQSQRRWWNARFAATSSPHARLMRMCKAAFHLRHEIDSLATERASQQFSCTIAIFGQLHFIQSFKAKCIRV